MLGIGDVHPIQVGPGPLPRVLPGGKRLEDMTPLEREVWTNGFHFRGGIKSAFASKGHEIIVGGPYETGKSFGLELKFYLMNAKYPNCRSLMIRKRYKDLVGSGIEMLRDNVIVNPWQPHPLGHSKCPVEVYGGTDEPKSLKFKNGSIIYFRGFDDPTKVLSAQYDFVYVVQAEELELQDWEQLLGRCTGRANNAPYPQVMGDCNPSGPNHWIKHRKSLEFYEQRHRDNPWLCKVDPEDPENEDKDAYTDEGKRTMKVLHTYSGTLRQRALEGRWVSPQGIVFDDLNVDIHIIEGRGFTVPESWLKFRSIDFGQSNPFVCQWWAVDELNIMYLYREIYYANRHIEEHAQLINELSEGENIQYTVVDSEAASEIETLRRHGIWTTHADKEKIYGIQLMHERFKVSPADNTSSIYFLNNSLYEEDPKLAEKFHPKTTFDSLISLIYPEKKTGSDRDEEPVKRHDHGFDACRYAIVSQDSNTRAARHIHLTGVNISTGMDKSKHKGARRDRLKNRSRGRQ